MRRWQKAVGRLDRMNSGPNRLAAASASAQLARSLNPFGIKLPVFERFAADIFARRTKTITKKAKRIRELDSQQRHRLRIAVKKLRYASDFFGHLFASRRAKKRLPRRPIP